MWLKKLRHRKLQFILAGIILFVSALVFAAGLGFMAEVGNLGEAVYNKDGAPSLLYMSNDERMIRILQETVPDEMVGTLTGVQITEHVEHNGTKISGMLAVYPLEDYATVPWELQPKEGDLASSGPAVGEIWVSRVWADLKDVHVGDRLTLQGGSTFRVSVLFNSHIQPSAQISINQFFLHPKDMQLLPELPVSVLAALSVQGELSEVKIQLASALEELNGLFCMDKDGFIESLTVTALLTGGMAMVSAILFFIVAVIVIRFMLRAGIIKEYRSIGIYKAQGFSNWSIRSFYLSCYAAVGAVSLLLGALSALPAITIMMRMVTTYVEESPPGSSALLLSVLAFLLLYAALMLNVLLATRSIKKITPVDALRIGVTSTKEKFTRSIIKNASSPLSMAVNDIGKYKGYSAMIVLILCVSFYLVVFSLVTGFAVNQIETETGIWLSLPETDIYVSGALDDNIIRYAKEHPDVADVVVSEQLLKTSVSFDDKYGFSSQVSALCFDNFSSIPYTKGRGPHAADEIMITEPVLNELGLCVGDYVSVSINGHKVTMLIIGTCQSMINGGQSVHLYADSLAEYGLDFVPGLMFIKLRGGADSAALVNELNRAYNSVMASESYDMITDAVSSIKGTVIPLTLILIVVFIAFSFLNIINLLLQNHADNRRSYGILKALGFSGVYITKRSAWKIFLLSVIAAAASLLLHVLLSKKIFAAMVIDALNLEIPAVSLTLCALLALVMIVTLLFCLPIRKITPKELMEE